MNAAPMSRKMVGAHIELHIKNQRKTNIRQLRVTHTMHVPTPVLPHDLHLPMLCHWLYKISLQNLFYNLEAGGRASY